MSKETETPQLDEKAYQAILADVQQEVASLLKSEREKEEAKLATLAKTHPGEENSSEPPKDTDATETAPKESAPESKEPMESKETPSAAPPTEAPAEPEAAPVEDVAEETGPIDPVELKAAYCQLPIEDLQVHYLACKEALVEKMGAQTAAAPAEAAPAPAPAPEPVAPPAPAAPAMKSEAEIELEALRKKQEETEESVGKLIDLLNKQLNVPLTKAIVSLTEVDGNKPQPELKNLKKSEVQAILRKKLESGKLTKSDEDLVLKFDSNMIKDVSQIAHLLTA